MIGIGIIMLAVVAAVALYFRVTTDNTTDNTNIPTAVEITEADDRGPPATATVREVSLEVQLQAQGTNVQEDIQSLSMLHNLLRRVRRLDH